MGNNAAAAASNEGQWYLAVDGQPQGPMTPADLRERAKAGSVVPRSMVWKDGMPGWSEISAISDLARVVFPPAAAPAGPPKIPAVPKAPPGAPGAPPARAAAARPAVLEKNAASKHDLSAMIDLKSLQSDATGQIDMSVLRAAEKEARQATGLEEKKRAGLKGRLFRFTLLAAGILLIAVAALLFTKKAKADTRAAPRAPVKVGDDALKAIWSGSHPDARVIQNRTYTLGGKVELTGFYGIASIDPLMKYNSFGGRLGVHFNDYLALKAMYLKINSTPSTALTRIRTEINTDLNVNPVSQYIGGELDITPIYGKLSLFGKAIIYYDLSFSAGAGPLSSPNGSLMAITAGVGQMVHVSRFVSLSVDWRMMTYQDKIVEKLDQTNLGKVLSTPRMFSNFFLFGLNFMIPVF